VQKKEKNIKYNGWSNDGKHEQFNQWKGFALVAIGSLP
jgi:hypothetical protein